jgi:hypothetical protein
MSTGEAMRDSVCAEVRNTLRGMQKRNLGRIDSMLANAK